MASRKPQVMTVAGRNPVKKGKNGSAADVGAMEIKSKGFAKKPTAQLMGVGVSAASNQAAQVTG